MDPMGMGHVPDTASILVHLHDLRGTFTTRRIIAA